MERTGIDAQRSQLLIEDLGRDAIEEDVHREDHDHEVVQPADDRELIGDEVPPSTRYPSAPASIALRPSGVRSSRISSQTRRPYVGARLAMGRNAARPSSRRTPIRCGRRSLVDVFRFARAVRDARATLLLTCSRSAEGAGERW